MKKKSLFILNTPLHSLIAKAISEKTAEEFCVIYFTSKKSSKDIYYYNQMRARCSESIFFEIRSVLLPIYLLRSFIFIRSLKIEKVYLAQVKTAFSRFLISLIKNRVQIISFDDGYGNLNPHGYFNILKENFISSLYFKLFKPNFLYSRFLDNIDFHYTIFPPKFNIFTNSVKLDLNDSSLKSGRLELPLIKVFLSTPFNLTGSYTKTETLQLMNESIAKIDPDYILPHPKDEMYHKYYLGDAKILETELIAEEWILNKLPKNNISLFAFNSTVLYNMSDVEGVKCTCIIDSRVEKPIILEQLNVKTLILNQ